MSETRPHRMPTGGRESWRRSPTEILPSRRRLADAHRDGNPDIATQCGLVQCAQTKAGQRPAFLDARGGDYAAGAPSAAGTISGRSTSSTSAIGALSPTRNPNLRMRR